MLPVKLYVFYDHFALEDEEDTFFRNFGNYFLMDSASQPQRWNSRKLRDLWNSNTEMAIEWIIVGSVVDAVCHTVPQIFEKNIF